MIEYPSREAFLGALPKGGKIAEIGVFGGEHARQMYKICQPTQLVLIDPWQTAPSLPIKARWAKMPQTELDSYYKGVCAIFRDKDNVDILKMSSIEASVKFEDGHFDWVYIDGDHSYKAALQDLTVWYPKIKKGGYLCGHDYSNTEAVRKKGDGVYDAVNDFIAKHELSVSFVAGDIDARCFAVKL